jgi:serine/threonine-protein kinase
MPDDPRLAELFDRWEEARERGEPLSPEQLCAECPEMVDELKRQIALLQEVDAKLPTRRSPAESTHIGDAPEGETLEADQLLIHPEFAELEFLAEGGLGAVYKATDQQLHRGVAVKFIRRRLATDAEGRARFMLEAEVTGRLEHPGVVPVYGVGATADGRLFYVMRFIEGQTLGAAIERFHENEAHRRGRGAESLEHRNLLQRFIAVCKTIAYAHNRGIVHRDVKPENVMLGRFGETIIIDWGLAAPVERDERFKLSGEHTLVPSPGSGSGGSSSGAGTPAYMSPEQASGLAPTPAGDVYSLGATLYGLLTGRPPFEGRVLHQLKQDVIDGRFPRPTQVKPDVAPALEAICLKAMALHPQNRYATALELAGDVERYLADEPVSAYKEPRSQKLARWLRRHRTMAQMAALGALLLIVVIGVSAVRLGASARSERAARLNAEQSRRAAEAARRENLRASAKLAARAIAQDIDVRWRILEGLAASPRLRELLTAINASPQDRSLWEPLQSWLYRRYIDEGFDKGLGVKSSSWIVNAADGTQVARIPQTGSIGDNFERRDYFHGRGRDLTDAEVEAEVVPPLSKPAHMSTVFESTNTGTLMVAFSVPIWSDSAENVDRRSIGILGMTVEIGDFEILPKAVLVDTRPDQLEGSPKAGLVLHHPKLGHRSREELPPRLNGPSLERALRLGELALDERPRTAADLDPLVEDFQDPVAGASGGRWLAAFAPVVVKGRPRHLADTGWVVIMEDKLTVENR